MYKFFSSNIKENIAKQASIVILITVCLFVLIYVFNFFHSFIEQIKKSDLLLSILLMFVLFTVFLFVFALARVKDILHQSEMIDDLKTDIKKSKLDNYLILDTLPSMVYYVDKNLRIIWANKTLLKYDNEAIGKYINTVFHEEDLPIQYNIIQKAIETNQIEKDVAYYPPNTLHTEEIYYEHYCIPLNNTDGEITSLLVISIDITGKMQLEESKGRLTAIVESSQDAIFVVDVNRMIHSWNNAAENMFGYSAKQIVGQPITILDHYINFETLIKISDHTSVLDTKSIKYIEFVELNKLDEKLYVSMTIYPFVDDIGKIIGISVIVRDKTEAILAQKSIVENEKQMRKLALHIDAVREEERKQIAFAIHDELGYALSAIKMDINWVKKIMDLSQEAQQIRVEGMLKLIDIAIQKVKTISSNLRPSILDHFGLIVAIEEQSADFQRRTGIRCKVSVDPPDIFIEDKLRIPIFRIFQEAQTNITRYAKASRVDVNISHKNGIFKMEVIDNGVGIPQEKIKAHSSFGLLGIREKAASINGIATIIGKPNEGTIVSLELPLP